MTGRMNVMRQDKHTPETTQERLASVADVPEHILGGIDRNFVVRWIQRGHDVYACQSPDGQWYLCLGWCHINLSEYALEEAWEQDEEVQTHSRLELLAALASD
jgi:hypothetical protein